MGSACLQSVSQHNEQTVYINDDIRHNSTLSNTVNSTMVFTYETDNNDNKHKMCKVVGPIFKKLVHKRIVNAQRKNLLYTKCNYSVIAM